jgi:hypothetical protein
MVRFQYNLDLLKTIIERDECVIDLETLKDIKITGEIRIDFICKCGENCNKTFRQIYKTGAICETCINKNKQDKMKEKCLEKYTNLVQNARLAR